MSLVSVKVCLRLKVFFVGVMEKNGARLKTRLKILNSILEFSFQNWIFVNQKIYSLTISKNNKNKFYLQLIGLKYINYSYNKNLNLHYF